MEIDVANIFDRDQRTIKNRRYSDKALLHITMDGYELCGDCKRGRHDDGFTLSRFPVLFFRISNFGMDSVTGRPLRTYTKQCKNHRKHINYYNFIKRLVRVFIFGVLLTIIRAPTVMSAPTSCRERDGAGEPMPNWINPCGQAFTDNGSSGSVSSRENDIGLILGTARIAEDYIREFMDNYTKETFRFPATHVPRWLPSREHEVPKSIGERVDPTHLESQSLDTFLQKIYRAMQKYAVGLEQVVSDQKRLNGKFSENFIKTELKLNNVLCELRSAMYNNDIKPLEDVKRCIMDEEARRISNTAQRNLRDWIILEQTLNGIEYLIQVLEYFNPKASS